MNGSGFIFDSVDLLHYKFQKVSLVSGASYIDSPKWLKSKKATINSKNNNCKCLQYALNHQKNKNNPARVSKIMPFIHPYICKEIVFSSDKNDWNELELNNKTIDLNILYASYNSKQIRHGYKSNHNLKWENKVILLMITDGKKWHYLAVKTLSALFRGITSNRVRDVYCQNCFHSFSTKNKLKKHENVCYIEMAKKYNTILRYIYGKKSIKVLFIIYVDLKYLLIKIYIFHNNAKKWSMTIKINIPLLIIHCLCTVYLMQQKPSMIFKAKIVWKHLQRSKKTCNKKSKLWKRKWYN